MCRWSLFRFFAQTLVVLGAVKPDIRGHLACVRQAVHAVGVLSQRLLTVFSEVTIRRTPLSKTHPTLF